MYLAIHDVFVIKGLKGIQIMNDGKSPTSYVRSFLWQIETPYLKKRLTNHEFFNHKFGIR